MINMSLIVFKVVHLTYILYSKTLIVNKFRKWWSVTLLPWRQDLELWEKLICEYCTSKKQCVLTQILQIWVWNCAFALTWLDYFLSVHNLIFDFRIWTVIYISDIRCTIQATFITVLVLPLAVWQLALLSTPPLAAKHVTGAVRQSYFFGLAKMP